MAATYVTSSDINKVNSFIMKGDFSHAVPQSGQLLMFTELHAKQRFAYDCDDHISELKEKITFSLSLSLAMRTLEVLSDDSTLQNEPLAAILAKICCVFMECAAIEFRALGQPCSGEFRSRVQLCSGSTQDDVVKMVNKVSKALPGSSIEMDFDLASIKATVKSMVAFTSTSAALSDKNEQRDFLEWVDLRQRASKIVNVQGYGNFLTTLNGKNIQSILSIFRALDERFEHDERFSKVFSDK